MDGNRKQTVTTDFIAECFLGRKPSVEEMGLTQWAADNGEPVVWFDPDFQTHKQNCCLYTSCHALPLRTYLSTQMEFKQKFNVNIVLVHRLLLTGLEQIKSPLIVGIFKNTSLILSNPFIGQYEPMNLKYFPVNTGTCFTYVPPNNAALWPVVEHFGERGVVELLEQGMNPEQIWQMLEAGTFDSRFDVRWNAQIIRLAEREKSCDIGISGFCRRNLRKCKLWFTENHPTYNLIGYVGSQLCKLAGFVPDSEDACAVLNPAHCGDWNASPETRYEFEHFRFEYPMRFDKSLGGLPYYKTLIHNIARRFEQNQNAGINDGLTSY